MNDELSHSAAGPVARASRFGSWIRISGVLIAGVVLPAAAFGLDLALTVDPLIWRDQSADMVFAGGMAAGTLSARQVAVYGLALLSVLGLLLHYVGLPWVGGRNRALALLSLPLLLAGVVLSGLHAVVFVPLLPVSALAILFAGIGLLGFSPYLALWVYARSFGQAFRRCVELCHGKPAPVLAAVLAAALPLGAAWFAVRSVDDSVKSIQSGEPASVSAAFRNLGPMAGLARRDLARAYLRLDLAAQARMRNLYLERFGRDIHEDLGGRIWFGD